MNVPFFRVELSDDDISGVVDTLKSGWITTGSKAKQFEAEFAKAVGAKYAIAVNSCTAALHLALEAVGIKRGDVVFVPALTFTATAEVVCYFGATPIFVDVDDTLTMNPDALRTTIEAVQQNKLIGGYSRPYGPIKAVMPMHYGGFACDMAEIMKIANEYSLEVVEDAAHTFPAYYRANEQEPWSHTGTFGKIGCFSFYSNKCITTGEGGMAVTNDEALANRMQLMSLHGMSKNAWKRFTQSGTWYYEIVDAGYKYNLTDIAASLGLTQLPHAAEFLARRLAVAERYNQAFKHNDALVIPPDAPSTRCHSWHLYPLRLNLDRLKIDRAQFIEELKEQGVACSVHYNPLPLNPFYRERFGTCEGMCPKVDAIWPRLVSLPLFPTMRDEEIRYTISIVEQTIEKVHK